MPASNIAIAQYSRQIRIARPTDKLNKVVRFYRDVLGLPVIAQFENHAGYTGVIFGVPTDRLQLEFTCTEAGSPCPAPTKDNLLVFYIEDDRAYSQFIGRLMELGQTAVEPENPYWKGKSVTLEDPDGWRIVIYRGASFADSNVEEG